jgi:hypothetical protein
MKAKSDPGSLAFDFFINAKRIGGQRNWGGKSPHCGLPRKPVAFACCQKLGHGGRMALDGAGSHPARSGRLAREKTVRSAWRRAVATALLGGVIDNDS